MDLRTIAQEVLNCNACPFRATLNLTSSPTPGFGSPSAKIMMVNLRTTLDAHEIDKPVGIRNEAMLKVILKGAGLTPKDIYFTNVIKCAGPVTPKKQFKANCITCSNLFLRREIELLNPQHIVCLGTSSYDEVSKIIVSAKVHKTYSLEEIYRHGKQFMDSIITLSTDIRRNIDSQCV